MRVKIEDPRIVAARMELRKACSPNTMGYGLIGELDTHTPMKSLVDAMDEEILQAIRQNGIPWVIKAIRAQMKRDEMACLTGGAGGAGQ